MKVTHTWLAEYVPGLLEHPVGGDPDALGDVLSEIGLTCEEVIRVGEGFDGIVVAEVRSLRPHPDADRIQLVEVDPGDGEAIQICCGAFNMAVGDKVPLATIGTTMPGGMEIARRKMRGEWSNGMLCSGRELEVSDDHDGILILDGSLDAGTPITDALGIVADAVFDLDLTPNRPDALSVIGVARDVAARLGLRFVLPTNEVAEAGEAAGALASVRIDDPELCGRFTVRVLSGVPVDAESPSWMQQRLAHCGMRPINAIVDASNYVMLEYGQPNHTYDLAKVPSGALAVRRATAGEKIVTLDGQTRELTERDGVIVDEADRAIGIAGVMGGESTEIGDGTDSVLLELAWWDPASISFTSKRLGLRSEASARYERGVDPEIGSRAALRFAELLVAQGATLHPGEVVAEGRLPVPAVVDVRTARVNELLGSDLGHDAIRELIEPLGFACEPAADGVWRVSVPSWRPDSTAEIDVVEEVARHHGYERLGRTMPSSPHAGGLTARQLDIRRLRSYLVASGASEATPMSFLAPGELEATGVRADGVRVANPLVAEESILRTSLLPGLVATLGYNAAHRNVGLSLFEVGHCFAAGPDGGLPLEWEEVAVVLGGRDARDAVELAMRIAEVLRLDDVRVVSREVGGLHPGRSGVVTASGHEIGTVGEVDPAVAERRGIGERVGFVSFVLGGDEYWHGGTGLLSAPRRPATHRSISRKPSSDVDLAFVVADGVAAADVAATLRSAGGDLVASVDLFDVYRGATLGEGRRSLAFRVRLQATDRTLVDEELSSVRQAMIDAAATAHAAEIRA